MATQKIEIPITKKIFFMALFPIMGMAIIIIILAMINQRQAYKNFLTMKAQLLAAPQLDELHQLKQPFDPTDEQLIVNLTQLLEQIDNDYSTIDHCQLIFVHDETYHIIQEDYCYDNEPLGKCYLTTTHHLDLGREPVIRGMIVGEQYTDKKLFSTLKSSDDYGQSVNIMIRLDGLSAPTFLYATYSWRG